tara:strand:- start:9 stop:461 length:453 start_codon:yes stop_codon:yes gene_type:complete
MRQNFEPTIWGPHAWFFLESVAMAYPTHPTYQEKKSADNFFTSLKNLIPCEKCRNNYISHLKIYPINDTVLSSRDNLYKWIVNIHNSVDPNKKKSYDETFRYYMKEYNLDSNENDSNNVNIPSYIKFIILFVFIFIITYLIYELYITLYI